MTKMTYVCAIIRAVTAVGICAWVMANGTAKAAEPPAGKPPPAPSVIYGVVQDEGGKAVPRARVWLRTGLAGQFQYSSTDADDQARFTLNVATPAWGTFIAIAKGYSFGSRNFSVADGQPAQRIVLTVRAPEDLRLRVLDEEGKPVQGAELEHVSWKTDNRDSLFLPIDLLPIAGIAKPVSDKDGMIVLSGMPKGAKCEGRIKHPDFARQKFDGIEADKKPVEVKLARGEALTVVAINGYTKKPVAGATVQVGSRESGNFSDRVDAEGRVIIRLAGAQYVTIAVHHPQLMSPGLDSIPRWHAVAGSVLETELFPKVKITGRCVDEKTGKPVSGIHLGVTSRGKNKLLSQCFSDDAGRYEMDAPEGPVAVEAIAFSGVDRRERRQAEADTTKSTQMPDLTLKMLPMVHGTVIGTDGKPVAGAFVMTAVNPRSRSALTDKDGRFESRIYDDFDGTTVLAVHPSQHSGGGQYISLDDLNAGKEVRIKLEPESEVRGTVVNSRGKPCPGVLVWLAAKTDAGGGFFVHPQVSTMTDAKGVYRFQGLSKSPRQYRVSLVESWDKPPVSTGWITPTDNSIILDPLTATDQILNAKPTLFTPSVPSEFRCRQWLNAPEPLKLDLLRGQVVLMVFGATWSKRMGWADELAEIQLAHKLYADKGLVVIGIQHHGERLEDVEAFIAKAGLTFPVGIDNTDSETFDRYGVSYYPQCVLIGRDGKRVPDQWRSGNFLAAIRRAVLYGDEGGK